VGFYGLMRAQLIGSALDYVRYGEEAAAIAVESGDPALRAAIGTLPAYGHYYAGDGRAVLEWSARVLAETGSDDALGKAIAGCGPRASMLNVRAFALVFLGRLEEAGAAVREADRVAEDSREVEVRGWTQLAWINLAYAREAIDVGHAGGCYYFEAQAQRALAAALLATNGVVPRAEIEAALARAEQLVGSIDGHSLSPRILEQRGRLAAALGGAPAAEQALRHALELYRSIGATGHAARLTNELGGSA